MNQNANLEVVEYLDDDLMPAITLSYTDRLEWHCERIRRNTPVFEFLESLDTGLDESDLINELLKVRLALRKVNEQRKLLGNPDFIRCKRGVLSALESAGHAVGCAKERHIWTARNYENQLVAVCQKLNVSSRPHLRVDEFLAGIVKPQIDPSSLQVGPCPAVEAVLESLEAAIAPSEPEHVDVNPGT